MGYGFSMVFQNVSSDAFSLEANNVSSDAFSLEANNDRNTARLLIILSWSLQWKDEINRRREHSCGKGYSSQRLNVSATQAHSIL